MLAIDWLAIVYAKRYRAYALSYNSTKGELWESEVSRAWSLQVVVASGPDAWSYAY